MPPVVSDVVSNTISSSNEQTLQVSAKVKEMSTHCISAKEEYDKNPSLKKSHIDELDKWVKQQPHLPPDITEEQLILFHHSCYYNIEDTKSCINVYYSIRIGTSEYFVERDVHSPILKQALDVLEYGILPIRDPNGYQIIFHRLKLFDASKYNFVDGVKLLSMSIDSCNMIEGTTPGYVFLFDMKGVKFSHLTRLSLSALRKFFTYVQEGLPVRLKAIHVVNTRPLIDKIMLLVKPFMKKDLMNMIYFHGPNDWEKLYKSLPPYCLPSDFGGELASCEEYHKHFAEWMARLKKHFDEDEKKYVRVDLKKNAKSKMFETCDFHDLAID